MISIKLYTDTTNFTAAFRKSFWSISSSQMKYSFYWWGITLYKAFLYHSKPIYVRPNGKTPRSLFHGMYNIRFYF